jgi:hypothetical protein
VEEVDWVRRRRSVQRSGLSEDEVEELARKIMAVICREWPRSKSSLDSSVIYARLLVEGITPSDYAMHDALKRLDGWFITPYLGKRSDDEIRVHSGMRIGSVNTSLCDEV